ncbi:MAG: hypothetical protein ACHREM_08180 [Polyangiales bacterium]
MADTETKPAAATQSKADFVRSLPSTLSPTEVVEKAKAAGIEVTNGYVSNIRFEAKARRAKKRAAKKAAKPPVATKAKAPAKKPAAPAKKPAARKTRRSGKRASPKKAFIASQPASMSATEVVAAAKKAGLKISAEYVYKARRGSGGAKPAAAAAPAAAPQKRKGGRPKGSKNKTTIAATPVAAPATVSAPKAASPAAKPSQSGDLAQGLARYVMLYGATRVREVLGEVEARFGSVFGIA